MALYRLEKDDRGTVNIKKDGARIGLYTNIHDFGITEHGWGGIIGSPTQVAFAVVYDVLQNKDNALAKYRKFEEAISEAAPFILELSTSDIQGILNTPS